MVFPAHTSPVWRSIIFGLELLKKGVIWRIGNGAKIKIWRHNWIPRGINLKPPGKHTPCRLNWVSQLIDNNTKEWDTKILKRFFFSHDVEEITKIKIPWNPMEDKIARHYEKTGCFTVRSAYRLGMQTRDLEYVCRDPAKHVASRDSIIVSTCTSGISDLTTKNL